MATITEDYVSFEIAKLLKEKDFDEKCEHAYFNGGFFNKEEYGLVLGNNFTVGDLVFAPTLQMAMKWLREKYNLFIQVTIVPHTTITMEQKYYLFLIHKDRRRLRRDDIPINYYNTYEEACEAVIKYCLENLI